MVNLQKCSASEFATFFRGMKLSEKYDFVNLYRNDIKLLEDPDKLRVLCECGYMMALIPMLSLVGEDEILEWKKSGWKTSNKKAPVKNVELWQKLDELRQKHEIRFVWVKGHAGHVENERCDELARNKASEFKI